MLIQATFHPEARAVVLPAEIDSKVLAEVRKGLPEDARYNLRFVVLCVRGDGRDATSAADVAWANTGLHRLGLLGSSGATDDQLASMVERREIRNPKAIAITISDPIKLHQPPVVVAADEEEEDELLPVAAAGAEDSTSTPEPTKEEVSEQPKVNVAERMAIEDKDPRRKRRGVVQGVFADHIVALWENGKTTEIKMNQLSRYRLSSPKSAAKPPVAPKANLAPVVYVHQEIFDKDPRRNRKGSIKTVNPTGVVVAWENGQETEISFDRLKRYKLAS